MDEMQRMPMAAGVIGVDRGQARVNVTYNGRNGDLPDAVSFDLSDDIVRRIVAEALRTGGIPGIPADENPDLDGFVIDRFAADEATPFNRACVRPKATFGMP